MTVVTEENITASAADIFDAFNGYGAFDIVYLLPESAFMGGQTGSTSATDWSCNPSFTWSPTFSGTWTGSYDGATLTVDATVTPSFSLSMYLGFGFHWYGTPEWFEAWIGASASVDVKLKVTASGAITENWQPTLLPPTALYTWYFSIDFVPVWINLDLSVTIPLTISAQGEVSFAAEADVGASFKAGAHWDDDHGWSLINQENTWTSFTGPTITINGTVTAFAGLDCQLSLMVYNIAGPFVEVEPYLTGSLTYVAADGVGLWNAACGIILNTGVTFAGWLKHLLHLHTISYTIGNWTIDSWSGRWGIAPSQISINIQPSYAFAGVGVLVSGTITSKYAGDKSGTVYVEYSTDNTLWNSPVLTTYSSPTGNYSCCLVIPSNNTYYVRALWNGNSGFRGAESPHITLTVQPTSAMVIYQSHGIPRTYIGNSTYSGVPTNTIYPDSGQVIAFVDFNQTMNGQPITFDFYTPDGHLFTSYDAFWNIDWWLEGADCLGLNINESSQEFWCPNWNVPGQTLYLDYTPYFGKIFTVEIYFSGVFVLNESFLFTKRQCYYSTVGTNPVYQTTLGKSVQLSANVATWNSTSNQILITEPGTLSFEYSTDQISWNNIASVALNRSWGEYWGIYWNGAPMYVNFSYYFYDWVPMHAGTYYIRAVWNGDPDYYNATSFQVILHVDPAPISLTTTLSANDVTYGTSVTITTSMRPPYREVTSQSNTVSTTQPGTI
jgi:hypothetical protein